CCPAIGRLGVAGKARLCALWGTGTPVCWAARRVFLRLPRKRQLSTQMTTRLAGDAGNGREQPSTRGRATAGRAGCASLGDAARSLPGADTRSELGRARRHRGAVRGLVAPDAAQSPLFLLALPAPRRAGG